MNLAKRYLTRNRGVDVQTAERMMRAGMTSPGNIAELKDEQLRELTGLENIKALRRNTVLEQVEVKLQND